MASFINPHDICFAHRAKIKNEHKNKNALKYAKNFYQQASKLDKDQLPPLPFNYAIPEKEPDAIGENLFFLNPKTE